ncbi:MAG: hypothetical protein LBU32_06860 [Clostridiales bacterium]|jgi:hypothetical protein|nr:hypothetical protein [Clostridiales bacterium]
MTFKEIEVILQASRFGGNRGGQGTILLKALRLLINASGDQPLAADSPEALIKSCYADAQQNAPIFGLDYPVKPCAAKSKNQSFLMLIGMNGQSA